MDSNFEQYDTQVFQESFEIILFMYVKNCVKRDNNKYEYQWRMHKEVIGKGGEYPERSRGDDLLRL